MGWGLDNFTAVDLPDIANEVELPIVTDDECTKLIAQTQAEEPDSDTNYTIREYNLCAGGEKGKSACSGDSGKLVDFKTTKK